jgi:hypothetical protein
MYKQMQNAYKVIHEICVETSNKLKLVSFDLTHVDVFRGYSDTHGAATYRNYYIEVTVSDLPADHTTGGTSAVRLQRTRNDKAFDINTGQASRDVGDSVKELLGFKIALLQSNSNNRNVSMMNRIFVLKAFLGGK